MAGLYGTMRLVRIVLAWTVMKDDSAPVAIAMAAAGRRPSDEAEREPQHRAGFLPASAEAGARHAGLTAARRWRYPGA